MGLLETLLLLKLLRAREKSEVEITHRLPRTGHEIEGTLTKLDDMENLSAVEVHTGTMTASDDLKLSSDTEETKTSGTYVKIKEFYIRIPGTYRMKFDMHVDNVNYTAYGRIYKNGAALGTERSNQSLTYITYSEDLRVDDGNLIQLYAKCVAVGSYRNFRLYGDVAIGAGVENAV